MGEDLGRLIFFHISKMRYFLFDGFCFLQKLGFEVTKSE